MKAVKTELFEPAVVDASRLAKALSHPARLEILRVLARRKACICGEIVDELPLAQSTVSQHLKALKTAGLISGSVEGPSVCYCLNDGGFRVAKESLFDLLDEIEARLECC